MRWVVVALLGIVGCGRIDFDSRADARTDAAPYAGPNRIFVTAAAYTGDMGGLAGTDDICQREATDAGLDGEFVALLWGSVGSFMPSSRLGGSRGWVDMTGAPIADMPTDFDTAKTFYPLWTTVAGYRIQADELLWTGRNTANCADWTNASDPSPVAVTNAPASLYSFVPQNGQCTFAAHLVCAERGHHVPVAPTAVAGRLAFISSTHFTVGSGLSGADSVCTSDATNAGKTGMFRAYLASSAGEAQTRFSPSGGPWVRPDGIVLSSNDQILSSDPMQLLDSFLDQHADGTPADGFQTFVGTPTVNCSDWNVSDGSLVLLGKPQEALAGAFRAYGSGLCNLDTRLVCLQL